MCCCLGSYRVDRHSLPFITFVSPFTVHVLVLTTLAGCSSTWALGSLRPPSRNACVDLSWSCASLASRRSPCWMLDPCLLFGSSQGSGRARPSSQPAEPSCSAITQTWRLPRSDSARHQQTGYPESHTKGRKRSREQLALPPCPLSGQNNSLRGQV